MNFLVIFTKNILHERISAVAGIMNTYNLNIMKKYFLAKIIMLIIFVFICCDRIENRFLYIDNNSNSSISCFITKREFNLMKKGDYFLAVDLKENEKGNLNPVKPTWERFIEQCDNNKLHFYIVSVDSINKYGLNTVFKQNIYIKKSISQ